MADLYIRSTDGSDSDGGSSWSLAKATLAGASAIDTAGDWVYVSQNHAESPAGAMSLAWAGTAAAPTKVVCGNDSAQPPASSATSASVATGATGSMTLNSAAGASVLYRGIAFDCGVGQAANLVLNASGSSGSSTVTRYQACKLRLATTGAFSSINFGGSNFSGTYLEGVQVRFSATAQLCQAQGYASFCIWNGGGIEAGSVSPASLFGNLGQGARIRLNGLDLSAAAAGMNIANSPSAGVSLSLRNCKLPSGWSGSLNAAAVGIGSSYEMFNCDSADTNYRYAGKFQFGSIRNETAIVRAGGATDGMVPYSWQMASTADATYPAQALDSPEIPALWNSVVGTPITLSVETLCDGVTLTDAEIWLEVQYLGTAGFPLSAFASDSKPDLLAAAASAQDGSAVTWATTGITTPVKQVLSVSVTPQEAGYLQAVVKLARPSTTVYVDPKMTVA